MAALEARHQVRQVSSSPSHAHSFWVKDHTQIYLIGNPVVWYLSTISVFAYVAVRALLFLRWKRGYKDFHNSASFLEPLD